MERIETPSAVMERMNADIVVCRYKTGVKMSAAVVRENLAARKQFAEELPFGVIGIVPEDADFEMGMLMTNVYGDGAAGQETHALAIVVQDNLLEKIAGIYLRYHPTEFPIKVFRHLQDAVAWIGLCLAERNRPALG
ncbi:MAG: hypothetical protein WAU70_06485 [Flavobacteriales bacterium]